MTQHRWAKGESGNPKGRAVEKPFRDALRIELAYIEQDEPTPAKVGSLRWNVRKLLEEGSTASIKELADRLDGKVPQAVIGSDDDPPIRTVNRIELVAGSKDDG